MGASLTYNRRSGITSYVRRQKRGLAQQLCHGGPLPTTGVQAIVHAPQNPLLGVGVLMPEQTHLSDFESESDKEVLGWLETLRWKCRRQGTGGRVVPLPEPFIV